MTLEPKMDHVTGQLQIRSNYYIRILNFPALNRQCDHSRKLRWAKHPVRAPQNRGINKALNGSALGRPLQGRRRVRQVDNVHGTAPSLSRDFERLGLWISVDGTIR